MFLWHACIIANAEAHCVAATDIPNYSSRLSRACVAIDARYNRCTYGVESSTCRSVVLDAMRACSNELMHVCVARFAWHHACVRALVMSAYPAAGLCIPDPDNINI